MCIPAPDPASRRRRLHETELTETPRAIRGRFVVPGGRSASARPHRAMSAFSADGAR